MCTYIYAYICIYTFMCIYDNDLDDIILQLLLPLSTTTTTTTTTIDNDNNDNIHNDDNTSCSKLRARPGDSQATPIIITVIPITDNNTKLRARPGDSQATRHSERVRPFNTILILILKS